MGYLQEFQERIHKQDYSGFLQLWEEYCAGDCIDGSELIATLLAVKESKFVKAFGKYVEIALPLWNSIENSEQSDKVLELIIDLQNTNTPELADIAYTHLKTHYSSDKYHNEKIRLIGLRNRDEFQGAITNYKLLSHMDKGKCVFHTGGWGAGEIVDISLVREQLVLEFEYVIGKKDLSFQNAFKNLIPLSSEHFLARRFGDPDNLEAQAKKDPLSVVHMLLKDLGPKTASEIKEELCELVIPEQDWTKWWQTTRAKLKKDTLVETPANIKSPFILRKSEMTHSDRFKTALSNTKNIKGTIQTIYDFTRDFPEILRDQDLKTSLVEQLTGYLGKNELSNAQHFQVLLFLDNLLPKVPPEYQASSYILTLENFQQFIADIDITAFKKRALVIARDCLENWEDEFVNLFLGPQQGPLQDYLLKQLLDRASINRLTEAVETLLQNPAVYPEAFLWYFQKLVASKKDMPFSDTKGLCRCMEVSLILLHQMEHKAGSRENIKRIHQLLTNNRYAVIRQILEHSNLEYAQEFLLLISKCSTFSDHDVKIMQSLIEVVHPSIALEKKDQESDSEEEDFIWTTQKGFEVLQKRIQHIGTVEIAQNAKEIEEARAHGDLRENFEFKSALQKQSLLQAELKMLSDQLNKARIITEHDVLMDKVGIGSVVQITNQEGAEQKIILLGPWDTDPEKGILSTYSRFAKSMLNKTVGDSFSFQESSYTVNGIHSVFNSTEENLTKPSEISE